MSKITKIFCLAPVMILFMFTQSTEAQRIRLETRMEGHDTVQAKARFEQRGERMKFNVSVEDAAASTLLSVVVKRGEKLIIFDGFIKTDFFGSGVIDLDTREGNRVDQLFEGDIIAISAANGDSLIGKFRHVK